MPSKTTKRLGLALLLTAAPVFAGPLQLDGDIASPFSAALSSAQLQAGSLQLQAEGRTIHIAPWASGPVPAGSVMTLQRLDHPAGPATRLDIKQNGRLWAAAIKAAKPEMLLLPGVRFVWRDGAKLDVGKGRLLAPLVAQALRLPGTALCVQLVDVRTPRPASPDVADEDVPQADWLIGQLRHGRCPVSP
ncbi:hypothetical protein SAMN02745857_03186 [Andreprevotia lacus DSM 23236]|uniref:Uncharacterized protein n=1 Tax=Andreprevotia lacus DSM 23236 TaxID=1121001 RepID=A0A1W1XXJ8_9NEIS|nr:hypothetical protein [Andreprevotia lacus]SMC28271.1 hypothetical protein SAMN02745857_03186 [Andreprevotia lacus DSM 23236]